MIYSKNNNKIDPEIRLQTLKQNKTKANIMIISITAKQVTIKSNGQYKWNRILLKHETNGYKTKHNETK